MAIDGTGKLAITVVVGMFGLIIAVFSHTISLGEAFHEKYDLIDSKYEDVRLLAVSAMHTAKTSRPNPYTSKDRERDAEKQERSQEIAIGNLRSALLLQMRLNMSEVKGMFLALELPPSKFLDELTEKERRVNQRLFNLEVGAMSIEKELDDLTSKDAYGIGRDETQQ